MKYILILLLFASCTRYTCPTNNGGREPQYRNKNFHSIRIEKVKQGWLVTTRYYRNINKVIYECLPDSLATYYKPQSSRS